MARQLELDAKMRREIAWTLKYAQFVQYDLQQLFNTWWKKRQYSSHYKEGREYWQAAFFGYVYAADKRTATGRCPQCGAKLKTMRCLGCDLANEMKMQKEKGNGNGTGVLCDRNSD